MFRALLPRAPLQPPISTRPEASRLVPLSSRLALRTRRRARAPGRRRGCPPGNAWGAGGWWEWVLQGSPPVGCWYVPVHPFLLPRLLLPRAWSGVLSFSAVRSDSRPGHRYRALFAVSPDLHGSLPGLSHCVSPLWEREPSPRVFPAAVLQLPAEGPAEAAGAVWPRKDPTGPGRC